MVRETRTKAEKKNAGNKNYFVFHIYALIKVQ